MEALGILFSFTRFIWVVGVMVAFIVASPVLAPYYALEKIYGRIKWVGIAEWGGGAVT